MREELTIATDPKEGAILLPFPECAAFDKPPCCPAVVDFACSVMVDRRIWRREPCAKIVSQLVPCEGMSSLTFSDANVRKKRTFHVVRLCFGAQWREGFGTCMKTNRKRYVPFKFLTTAIRLSSFVSESSR